MVVGLIILVAVSILLVVISVKDENTNNNSDEFAAVDSFIIKDKDSKGSINCQKKSIDDIYKYKELLDMGAITQEEFDQKKKELLDL